MYREVAVLSTKMMIELFVYLGSALVVVSMLMTSVVRLRIINLAGSVIFAIYALIIKSYPTAFMNFFLVGINLYHLYKLFRSKKTYKAVQMEPDDGYVDWFVKEWQDDILTFFPDLMTKKAKSNRVYAVFCEDKAAGIVIGNQGSDGKMVLAADYTTPAYRDCSIGAFLTQELPKYGVKELVYKGDVPAHVDYVEKTGFTKGTDGSYRKRLGE